MKDHAKSNNIDLAGVSIYMSPRSLGHARRNNKVADGKAVDINRIAKFPKTKSKMDLYWDGECYIYTDYINKFIAHPSYEMKISHNKTRKVAFVTAGKVTDVNEFRIARYKKV